jgi:hypothetical protein
MAAAEGRDAGVSGGRMELHQSGALGDLPREGVLASAGADDEDLHGRRV